MSFFSESLRALLWVTKVLSVFWNVRPWTTVAVILAKAAGRFTSLLSFFLPLKVILLAGSDGIPNYFQFFIEPETKAFWIVVFSLGAVACYFATLMLGFLEKSFSNEGGVDVLSGADELAVGSHQRKEIGAYYSRFSGVVASALIVIFGFVLLAATNSSLATVLVVVVVVEYLLAASVVEYGDHLHPGRLLGWVKYKLQNSLDVLGSINFLLGFFILLMPFLLGGQGNLLFAILSILVMRQSFGAMKDIVKAIVDLWKDRQKIDPMIFRHHQVVRPEPSIMLSLKRAFPREKRGGMAKENLAIEGDIECRWKDSSIKGVYSFHLWSDGQEKHWLQQVFPKKQLHLLEHESLLFSNVSRSMLMAPLTVARVNVGPFECQICEYGNGVTPEKDEWEAIVPKLVKYFWSMGLPHDLLESYSTSRRTLGGRLTREYLQRMEVAVDTPENEAVYVEMLAAYPRVKQIISRLPLYVYNPDMIRKNAVFDGGGNVLIMSWGRWSIEHIGSSVPSCLGRDDLEEILVEVRKNRGLKEDELTLDHIDLVRACRDLEKEILGALYGQALISSRRIVGNSLISL